MGLKRLKKSLKGSKNILKRVEKGKQWFKMVQTMVKIGQKNQKNKLEMGIKES